MAAVLDLYSRRIVGWAMSGRMTSDLTMAIRRRQPDLDLIHHSDQGSQPLVLCPRNKGYTDGAYQALLKDHDIQVSMNGVGTWYDNALGPVAQGHRAPMESFFGTLKSEWVNHHVYRTRDEARADIFYYIEAFYNLRRLHSSLDYLSP